MRLNLPVFGSPYLFYMNLKDAFEITVIIDLQES